MRGAVGILLGLERLVADLAGLRRPPGRERRLPAAELDLVPLLERRRPALPALQLVADVPGRRGDQHGKLGAFL
jgi:hypothetical protein